MKSRQEFARQLARLNLSHADRAIALLWYYQQSREFEERTAAELANDLHDEGFPKPHSTRLHAALQRSHLTIRGKRSGTFQIDLRREAELNEQYSELLDIHPVEVEDSIIPSEWVVGTRNYLEQMVVQINGCYQFGFFDACAVLCRRLMESLIIEIYIHQGREHEIKQNKIFLSLEDLIVQVRKDPLVTLSRNSPKSMMDVKHLGDIAAHNRVYITNQVDIDDLKFRFRGIIKELLVLAGITK